MTSTRKLFVSAGLILFTLASAYATLRKFEIFPILRYPMYSEIMEPGPMSYDYIYGVEAAHGTEFPLQDPEYIAPFDRLRLRTALVQMEDDDARVRALQDVLTRYETARQAGKHDGPALRELRVYRETWENFGPDFVPGTPPDRRELVLVVPRPLPPGSVLATP